MSNTISFYDTEYPIIASLENGYHLVAHPNGPAICNGDHMSTIDIYDDDGAGIATIKRKAIRLYREWSWPKLRAEFFPPTPNPHP